jgi:CRISPR/Cas system CSM-associated protein Csm3 (group 7 of RAMP superfamily)
MGMNKDKNTLTGKIILKAKVTNTSPLLIGTGYGEDLDFELIRTNEGKPYIPSSGFAGMLRKNLESAFISKPEFEQFFGTENTSNKVTFQSHFLVENLCLSEGCAFKESVRDGVCIDSLTSLAIDEAKMDYELLEPGAIFDLNAEISLRTDFNENVFEEIVQTIAKYGESGKLQQGAFKNTGFGYLEFSDVRIYKFQFPEEGKLWFEYLDNTAKLVNSYDKTFSIPSDNEERTICFEGTFQLKSSLIIRSDPENPLNDEQNTPDKVHLRRNGKALITGKSYKGVIRHRALKILNTLENLEAKECINDLFGFVIKKDQKPSRVKTFETDFDNFGKDQVQPRVKIDRFTGGTIEGALMQTKPEWHDKESIILRLELKTWKPQEAGLILLVMKDLMNEDLAIGGEKTIGRGILMGKSLTVWWKENNQAHKINFDEHGILIKEDKKSIELMNEWVKNLDKSWISSTI